MPDCFIIMPITTPDSSLASYSNDKEHFLHVLEHLFKPAITKAGLNPLAPIAEGSDIIHAEIIKHIEQADLVLCDMSTLNPNVLFELGIRTAVDKPVCIVKDDVTPRVPFDTTIINNHTYLSALSPWTLEKQIEELASHIEKSKKRSNGQNTLWKYFGLSKRAVLAEGKEGTESRLDLLSLQVESLSRTIQRREETSETRQDGNMDLFNDLCQKASVAGTVVLGGGAQANLILMKVKQGTLNDKVARVLIEYAKVHGAELMLYGR